MGKRLRRVRDKLQSLMDYHARTTQQIRYTRYRVFAFLCVVCNMCACHRVCRHLCVALHV